MKLPVKLSSKQNEKVVKGLWNLCIKFWEDYTNEQLYEGIDPEVGWGLFSMLNYNLLISNRERMVMREKLKEMKLSSKIFWFSISYRWNTKFMKILVCNFLDYCWIFFRKIQKINSSCLQKKRWILEPFPKHKLFEEENKYFLIRYPNKMKLYIMMI